MHGKQQFCNSPFAIISRAAVAALAMTFVLALTVILTQSAQGQTFKVIHTFSGSPDGAGPSAGLTIDGAGNLYGTAFGGGSFGGGTVFRLSYKGSGWIFNTLYSFTRDGNNYTYGPGRVIFGPNGGLYGTEIYGGNGNGCSGVGCGTVFNVRPSPVACKTALCPWEESVLYSFLGGSDGYWPGGDALVFDPAGNIYGTTIQGGSRGAGTVYMLAPSGGGWKKSIIYSFTGKSDGDLPEAGVILDNEGNLYGASNAAVYELTPSNGSWIEKTLYSDHGIYPQGGVIFDPSGNLYGTSISGGQGGGMVFELTPAGGNWTYSLIYGFTGIDGPRGSLTMDAAGNLYGTTFGDGAYNDGNVFKLTPSGGGWTYTDLYDFTGGSDGGAPFGPVVLDANGNLYGTASRGGSTQNCCGVVWEITP